MITWTRSSYCGSAYCVEVAQDCTSVSSCVEVANIRAEGDPGLVGVLVRDSKNPAREPLVFTAEEWRDFVQGVKAGEFG